MTRERQGARSLEILNEIARVSTEGLELGPILQRVTDLLLESLGWDHVGFARVDREQGRFVCEAVSTGIPSEITRGYERPLGTGVVGAVAASGTTRVLADVAADADYVETAEGIACEVCLPIVHGGDVVAVLNLEHREARDLEAELPLLEAVIEDPEADRVLVVEAKKAYNAIADEDVYPLGE